MRSDFASGIAPAGIHSPIDLPLFWLRHRSYCVTECRRLLCNSGRTPWIPRCEAVTRGAGRIGADRWFSSSVRASLRHLPAPVNAALVIRRDGSSGKRHSVSSEA